jgi:phenylpropionate dioxygenase-like ring-hydroxylating dioxygenase large terminal subunit
MSLLTTTSTTPTEDFAQRHRQGLQSKPSCTEVGSTLPDAFYHSKRLYELERRAIFSRKWFLVCHKARLAKVGDFAQYEFAGYNFVLVKEKSGTISGFHNICRHRAFPVVREAAGNAKIFSCKYHGWSYDLGGHLTKAPRFTAQHTPSFEAAKVQLYPVHVHNDRNGFVYVNLDAAPVPEVSWESQYHGLDVQEALLDSGINWDAVEYDRTWAKEGDFNWKVMQDNYNECYHCRTAHPDVAKSTVLDTYFVIPAVKAAFITHHSEPKASVISSPVFEAARFKGRSQTYVYPGGHFSPNPGTGFMHLMRSCPISTDKTRQEYDVYKLNTATATPQAHRRMLDFYQKVVEEDFELCEGVQRNIARGIYERGPLHPFHEEGVGAFQKLMMRDLLEHSEMEAHSEREINRAKPSHVSEGQITPGSDNEVPKQQMFALCEWLQGCDKSRAAGIQW